jgi:hypothetical protein
MGIKQCCSKQEVDELNIEINNEKQFEKDNGIYIIKKIVIFFN